MGRYEKEAKEQRKDHIDKHSEETMDEERLNKKEDRDKWNTGQAI